MYNDEVLGPVEHLNHARALMELARDALRANAFARGLALPPRYRYVTLGELAEMRRELDELKKAMRGEGVGKPGAKRKPKG